jgi:hypothetical protein
MTRRLTVLFATTWIILTIADHFTTHLGVTVSGQGEELNPFGVGTFITNTVSGAGLLLLGCLAVGIGSWRLKGRHPSVLDPRFKVFLREAFAVKRMFWTWLVVAPLLFACGRVLPVLSNVSLLCFGASPLTSLVERLSHATGATEFTVYLTGLVTLMWILALPVTYVVHLGVRNSSAEQTHGETTSDAAPRAESEASHA